MRTDPGLVLAQWFSPGYPVGAFAYSHGLETAIAGGAVASAEELEGWVRDVMEHGSGRNDAILIAAAYRAEGAALGELDALAGALCVSAERETETRAQGAAFARTTSAAFGVAVAEMAYPVAVGRAARLMGLPVDAVLRHYLLGFAGNLISVGVRLVPLGQTEGQRALAALAGVAARVALEAEAGDVEALGGAAWAADIQSMRHEALEVRVFRT